jgi:hypothetical protein
MRELSTVIRNLPSAHDGPGACASADATISYTTCLSLIRSTGALRCEGTAANCHHRVEPFLAHFTSHTQAYECYTESDDFAIS